MVASNALMYVAGLFPGVKRPGLEVDHTPSFSAEVQKLNLRGDKDLLPVLGFELRLLVTRIY